MVQYFFVHISKVRRKSGGFRHSKRHESTVLMIDNERCSVLAQLKSQQGVVVSTTVDENDLLSGLRKDI